MKELKKHLKDHGLTYNQHLLIAYTYAWKLWLMSAVAIIHGVFPFLFQTYVTDKIKELNKEL